MIFPLRFIAIKMRKSLLYNESQIFEYIARVFDNVLYNIFKIKCRGEMSLILIYQLHSVFRGI